MTCALCDGGCEGADLGPLLTPELRWLWSAVAVAADRRGDARLIGGPPIIATVPASPAERAAAAGLLGSRPLTPGQRCRVDLADLVDRLAVRGCRLTPGAVASHAIGRRLAEKARARIARDHAVARLRRQLEIGIADLPRHVRERIGPDSAFDRLRTGGWVARILSTDDPVALVESALAVLGRLPAPGDRVDRRTLVPGNPHALDEGVLPALTLALTRTAKHGARSGWAALRVDCDDLLGGLIVTGICPDGWHVPAGATLTLPPRELRDIRWSPPAAPGRWVFVTENPSVLAAAVGPGRRPAADVPRIACMAGTPSQLECQAIGALMAAGWRVAVRADFDPAGLAHVRAVLAVSQALPWRMNAADYLLTDPRGTLDIVLADGDAPWDPELVSAMRERGAHVYEEDLLALLVGDIAAGRPATSTTEIKENSSSM